jgi:hypothetical protein
VDGTATMPPVIGTITQPTCSDLTGSVVLNNLPAPGTWTLIRVPNGSSVIGTGTSTTISNLSVGTYSFKYSNGSGCISLPSANVIIVPKTATPTGDTIQFFSTGATVGNLAATGTAIKWYADASGGPALSITKLLDSYSHYYASQTLSGCESTNRLDVMVTVNVPQTIAVSGNVNPGISKCYNATQIINVAGGTTYTVHDGSSATMIAWQNIKYLHGVTVEPGGYMHGSISLSEHCALKASSFISAVPGKDEPSITSSKSFFKLYPNPTNGKFTIEQKSEKEFSSLKFEIFDIFGDRLLIENITGEKKHECRLFDRAQGLYFVKVIADDYSETFKLILTR